MASRQAELQRAALRAGGGRASQRADDKALAEAAQAVGLNVGGARDNDLERRSAAGGGAHFFPADQLEDSLRVGEVVELDAGHAIAVTPAHRENR